MNKFKIGDRVVVYDRENKYKGTVTASWPSKVKVQVNSGIEVMFWAQQCSKLKPKSKTRRTFRGEWKRMYPTFGSDAQQMAFIPYEPFVNLVSLDGSESLLREVKGNA